jgi:hypothetical protein
MHLECPIFSEMKRFSYSSFILNYMIWQRWRERRGGGRRESLDGVYYAISNLLNQNFNRFLSLEMQNVIRDISIAASIIEYYFYYVVTYNAT